MCGRVVLLIGGLALACAVSASAQDSLSEAYGSGVHAYFAGDYATAHQRLTSAIAGGTKDPRAFYFRGLACLKLGRPQEAAVDFRQGAQREAKDEAGFYNVGKSLERVQGNDRVAVEGYRAEARKAAAEQAERIRKARYEAIRRDDSRVVRESSVGKAATSSSDSEEPNPFGRPGDKPEKKRAKASSGDQPKKDNPFATGDESGDEGPAAKSGKNPFGEDGGDDKAAPKSGKSPFGDDEKSEEKPAPKAEAKSNPFGDDDKPAEKPAPKAEEKSNPFGDDDKPGPKASDKPAPKTDKDKSVIGPIGRAIGKAITGKETPGGEKKSPSAGPVDKGNPDKPAEKKPSDKKSDPANPFD
jgi:hypothetical protein